MAENAIKKHLSRPFCIRRVTMYKNLGPPPRPTWQANLPTQPGKSTCQINLPGQPVRSTWQINLAGQPGRPTWQVNLPDQPGRSTCQVNLPGQPARSTCQVNLPYICIYVYVYIYICTCICHVHHISRCGVTRRPSPPATYSRASTAGEPPESRRESPRTASWGRC